MVSNASILSAHETPVQVSPPTDESTRLQASVRTLASGTARLLDERLRAVRTLAEAPALPVWERGLLLALGDPKPEVRNLCLQLCRERLERQEADPEQQDSFLKHLLEACFTPHRAALSETYAKLLRLIADALLARPLHYEHHRSLLLLGVTNLQFTRTHAPFAAELTKALKDFAAESERSDTLVVQHLQERQKLRAYTTLGTPPEVLRLYLEADSSHAPDQIGADLLEAYATLLAQAPSPGPVLHLLLDNLRAWLHDAPQRGRLPPQLLIQALQAARGKPWDTLAPALRRQLLVGQALAGGPEAPGDLLSALQHGYTYVDDPSIAPRIMDLLARLSATRARIPQLCAYLSDPGLQTMPPAFWSGALGLLEALATGLAEQPTRTLFAPEMERLVRPQRTAWQIGARDIALRRQLERLAGSAFLPAELRLRAWRALLRTLPQDQGERQRLYAESMASSDDARLPVALEAAAEDRQRSVWQHIARLWSELTVGDARTPGRAERLRLVCRLYAAVRDPAAVTHQDERIPPLLALALDDPDPEVHAAARQALDDARLAPALEYEAQRRLLNQQELEALRLEREERDRGMELAQCQQLLDHHRQQRQQLGQAAQTLERERQRFVDDIGYRMSIGNNERRTLQTNLHTYQSQMAQFEQELLGFDNRMVTDRKAIATEYQQLERLTDHLTNLTAQAAQHEDYCDQLRDECERMRKLLGGMPHTHPDFDAHLAWLERSEQELDQRESQMHTTSRYARATRQHIHTIGERITLLKSGYEHVQRDRRRCERQLAVLRQQVEHQRRQLIQLRVAIEQIHAEEQQRLVEIQAQNDQLAQLQRRNEQQIGEQERRQATLASDVRTIQRRHEELDAATKAGRRRALALLARAGDALRQADQRAEEEQIRHENTRWVEQELFVGYCEYVMRNT